MSKDVAIYVRVSKSKGQDLATQQPDIERYEKAHGIEGRWFADKHTGKVMDRPGFNKLMEGVQQGKIKTIIVWRLDRLGRTAKGLTALFQELIDRNVNLISIKDGLDLSTAAGRLMANVLASVAQYETEVRAERIHNGLEAARAAGKKLGPAKGTRSGVRTKASDGKIRVVLSMKAEGQSIAEIARVTDLSRPTVYSILKEAS